VERDLLVGSTEDGSSKDVERLGVSMSWWTSPSVSRYVGRRRASKVSNCSLRSLLQVQQLAGKLIFDHLNLKALGCRAWTLESGPSFDGCICSASKCPVQQRPATELFKD
jgi:hypothetical protein